MPCFFPDAEVPDLRVVEPALLWLDMMHQSGTPTIVRCQEGLNRSLFLLGLWIVTRGHADGHTAVEALRAARSRTGWYPLSNEAFVRHLHELS